MNLVESISIEKGGARAAPWHAVWVRSNSEHLVADQLRAKGLHPFVAKVCEYRGARRRPLEVPAFPGYVLLNDELDKQSHVDVLRARGVVRVLGRRWDHLDVVPPVEIESVRRLLASELPTVSYPYLSAGRRVRVVQGPLAGVEGLLVESAPDRGLLVVSVSLFKRSLAVELACAHVAAA